MTNREDAVSEAIGGVLLIALVVIGAALVGTYIMSQPLPEKIPKVQFSVKEAGGQIYLEHEGGETLDRDAFNIVVDGAPIEGSAWVIDPDDDRWSLGSRINITGYGSVEGNPKSVGLVYSGGSGATLLRSSSSPWGFNYVLPGYDPSEQVNLPPPEPGAYSPWDPTKPETWPVSETSVDPSADTDDFTTKVAYVAAHDSTMTAFLPEPPLYVCDGNNDEEEINHALNRMQGGGTVILLDGSFHCADRIRVPGHTKLAGQGSATTMIEVLPKSPGGSGYLPVTLNQPNVTAEGFSLWGNGFVMVTTSHVRVRDVMATSRELDDPTVMRRASGNGMFFVWATTADLMDIEFYKCIALECNTHGFNMNQEWDIGGPDSQAKTIGWVRFVGCQAITCGYGEPESRSEWITGFDFHEWQDLRHMWAIDCLAQDNWESGFHLEPGGRYDATGAIIGARTISEDIHFVNCRSIGNGQRNTHSGAFFMSGFYLSRNTTLENCQTVNNRNSGYYVHSGENSAFIGCTDDGSTYGWKVCKASSKITLDDCSSSNNPRWALWLSFSDRITVTSFEHTGVTGDRGYQNILGWYKDESKYQLPVTNSYLQITAIDNGMAIINRAGSGNSYDLTYG